jgi:Flp pilus assembly protein TadG
MAAAAFAVDISMIMKVQNELQRTADTAAMAGAWELVAQLNDGQPVAEAISAARIKARQVAAGNSCGAIFPDVDLNTSNDASGEIVVGRFTDFGSRDGKIKPDETLNANALAVTVYRTESRNGAVNFVFGRLLGATNANLSRNAIAAFVTEIRGFKQPSEYNLPLLPFAVSEDKWNELLQGTGNDNYRWDDDSETVQTGTDGIIELEMYAGKTGASGNLGTIDLGTGSGTNDLNRQIVDGLNSDDFAAMGGSIELSESGTLTVSGDTGIPV